MHNFMEFEWRVSRIVLKRLFLSIWIWWILEERWNKPAIKWRWLSSWTELNWTKLNSTSSSDSKRWWENLRIERHFLFLCRIFSLVVVATGSAAAVRVIWIELCFYKFVGMALFLSIYFDGVGSARLYIFVVDSLILLLLHRPPPSSSSKSPLFPFAHLSFLFPFLLRIKSH